MNWKKKLASRKFWLAVVGFIAPLLSAFGLSGDVKSEVCAIIMAGGAVIAYIIAEGFIDAKGGENGEGK